MLRFLLANTNAIIRGVSRDENKQSSILAGVTDPSRVRLLLGDIRDLARLRFAMHGVDIAWHAAALKYVDAGERDPHEFVQTNINGTYNVITACIEAGVKKAVLLNSDKSTAAISLYGSTKAVAEKLWIRANGYSPDGTSFYSLRYGNVNGSRGSVIEKWRNAIASGKPLLVTNPLMTRFYISLEEAVRLAWFAAMYAPRGTILVPHIPAYTVGDLLMAFCEEFGEPLYPVEMIPVRAGEKHHEQLLADHETAHLIAYTDTSNTPLYYAIPPVEPTWEMPPWQEWDAEPGFSWQPTELCFRYSSDVWPYRLSVDELRIRLKQ